MQRGCIAAVLAGKLPVAIDSAHPVAPLACKRLTGLGNNPSPRRTGVRAAGDRCPGPFRARVGATATPRSGWFLVKKSLPGLQPML